MESWASGKFFFLFIHDKLVNKLWFGIWINFLMGILLLAGLPGKILTGRRSRIHTIWQINVWGFSKVPKREESMTHLERSIVPVAFQLEAHFLDCLGLNKNLNEVFYTSSKTY